MKKWTKLAIPIVAVAALVAWYAFRPERLVVNRRVDEAIPTAQGGLSPQPLVSGQFYSTAPDSRYRNHLPDGRWHPCSSLYRLQHVKRS